MAKKKQKAGIRFDVHPSVAEVERWIKTLKEKTGRTLEGWMKHIKKDGPRDEKEAKRWLRSEYELGTNTAWWLVERAFAKDLSLMDDDPERYMKLAPKYVEAQYAGKREALKRIFEKLYALGRGVGKNVKVCPCKTMVPFYRAHVFANIKPTTMTRVDLGLCLTPMMKAGKKLPARLVETGGYEKRDRITHRIGIAGVDEVDGFVKQWLERAYEMDGKKN